MHVKKTELSHQETRLYHENEIIVYVQVILRIFHRDHLNEAIIISFIMSPFI